MGFSRFSSDLREDEYSSLKRWLKHSLKIRFIFAIPSTAANLSVLES